MQYHASTQYALSIIARLAATPDDTSTSNELAKSLAIPRPFVIQLCHRLRPLGIIESAPGKYGGYRNLPGWDACTIYSVAAAVEPEHAKTEFLPQASFRDMTGTDTLGRMNSAAANNALFQVTDALRKMRLGDVLVPVGASREEC